MTVVLLGQIARDLVLRVDGAPREGRAVKAHERRELLGGKGANQAVGLAHRGSAVHLIGVVGDDPEGERVLAQAQHDRIGTSGVVIRPGTRTALHVDLTDGHGARWLVDDVPEATLITCADIDSAAPLLLEATALVIQLQQPADAALHAVHQVRDGTRIYLDGAPSEHRSDLLAAARAVRADADEAEELAGHPIDGADAALEAARALLSCGPTFVALAFAGGDVVAWPDGERVLPNGAAVADPTGGGDAFMAALVHALEDGHPPEEAAHRANAAAAVVVTRIGGRPPAPA